MSMENPFRVVRLAQETPSPRRRSEGAAQETAEQESLQAEIVRNFSAFLHQDLRFASGTVADVYRASADSGLENLCVKSIERKPEKRVYENGLEEEMDLQTKAFKILRASKKQPVAAVPFPFAYLRTKDDKELFAMERIEGKTLYRLLLEHLSEGVPSDRLLPGMRRVDVGEITDEELEELVLRREFSSQTRDRRTLSRDILKRAAESPFLPPTIALQVRNAVQTLHAERFFHRDLHEKNILISNDLQHATIIDFGASSYQKHSSQDDACDTEQLGTKLRFPRDTGILTTLASLTVKPAARH